MRTCAGCSNRLKPSEQVYCDPCHTQTIRGLLDDPVWLTWRGNVAPGDLPGETLADTLRRELAALEVRW